MDDIVETLDRVCRELEKRQLWTALKDAEYVKKKLSDTDRDNQINEELRGLYACVDASKVDSHAEIQGSRPGHVPELLPSNELPGSGGR